MMPRSSRHKSNKHSSRDARDYSDSDRDTCLKEKEKKTKEESKPGSGDKRKLDSKDTWFSGNGDYAEEYSSLKRRNEKVDVGASDRWNDGEDDDKGEKKSRGSSESKSKKQEDAEGDDTKRIRSEGKYRESSRKEEREKEKKGKEGKSDRPIEADENRPVKRSAERTDRLRSPESESQLERRFRKRRDASGDGDKRLEDNGDNLDKQLSLNNDSDKDGRAKDEKHKDERYKDKYQEVMDYEDKWQDDKLKDDRPASDHANCKSSEKLLRDGKDDVKVRQKKSKAQDSDFDRDHDCDHYRERERDRRRERYRDLDRDYYRERDHSRDHDRDYDSPLDRDRDLDRERERDRRYSDRDNDRDLDRDELHDERRSARYKDSKGRKRSPDDRDAGNDTKYRGARVHYSDIENKSTSGRVEVDADRGRSQSRPANLDAVMGSNRRRASPSSRSHGGTDEYRHLKQDNLNCRDLMTEQRSKAASSREVTSFSETSERGAKYRSTEKSSRVEEGHSGEFERSSSLKASPMSMMEKSPSTSLECRYTSRSGVRRGLDIEETGWSNASIGGREEDNRLTRDLPPEKPLLDGSSQSDFVFYNRAGQGNSSLNSHPPGLRSGVVSPFMGSLEEDIRFSNSGRYKRGDLNVRRGHANAWRGAPNWPPPVPNSFIPFQPGPPHGGFQMMPQFPSPSLFNVRPSMDVNHSGIPYHIPDSERFNNHMRPMGWQNTMDGSAPAHFHGWDGHNVTYREEGHIFGGLEWDQNRHPVNGRGWDTNSDVWKGQNADFDLASTSQKEDHPLRTPLDDVYDGQECQRSQYENGGNSVQVKDLEIRPAVMSPVKESFSISPEIPHKAPDSSKISSEDVDARYCQVYLSKIDISEELAGPDLYDQCMGILSVEQSKDFDKDVKMLVNLKNGARPVQKASIAVLSPSLIPATNAAVFQKAMDIYKKRSLQVGVIPNVNGGTLAFTSASKEKGKEQSSDHVVDGAEEPVLMPDAEIVDSAMEDSDQQKGKSVPATTFYENMEQLASIQRSELPNHPDSYNLGKSDQPNTDFVHMNAEVPEPVLNGNKAEETETEQQMNSLDNAPEAVYCAEERHSVGRAVSCPLNDSPKESESQIPGSNESGSESVILSRIHHSPENTH
ncbi:zinc finger CCCH domain-containing protein 13-like isoform X2 [Hibiscus syriacus]|uniref:zinc finger CCCH domain-containing protein 13-like isoform X2 n=1 Tax=Hibiscus syriacus TaxID=106335 RepID=UPI001923BA2D|nr:zinc finger CCCH domain-containing protein 13-like isoform X2 [Hibiscus syriacus]